MLRKPSFCQGFTLVEMLVAMAVLIIVISMGMPSYNIWIQNTRLRNAAESMQNGLQLARAEAVARNRTVRFSLGAGSSWSVCEWDGNACTEDIQSRATGEGSSTAVTVAAVPAVVLPDIAYIDFDAMGMGRGTATRIDIDLDPDVVPAVDSRNLRVLVAGGSVRMCDPNVAAPDVRAC